jgi:siderophore synthetase component
VTGLTRLEMGGIEPGQLGQPALGAEHLTPERMARAERALVAKALSEFAHERIIRPVPVAGEYQLDAGVVTYRFSARILPLDDWVIEPSSIRRTADGTGTQLSAQQLMLDLRSELDIDSDSVPLYLEELAATLAGRAWKLRPDAPTSRELLSAPFQQIEAAMTEGHPCFVANNGRIGFGVADHRRFAPEVGAPIELVWLAVRRDLSQFASIDGLSYSQLIEGEFDADQLTEFDALLGDLGLDPGDYRLMPCHPWQWDNKVAVALAPEVGRREIVPLAIGRDAYQVQQSVRTMFNLTRPTRCYVKTALSVLNMGFMRGLSPEYMATTPLVNDWVAAVISSDQTLRRHGFSILREVAAVGFEPPAYQDAGRSGYRRMLSALWRESPVPSLGAEERLASMTSLLHVDADGRPYVAELIEAGPLGPAEWLRQYLDAYLVPVLQCFYAHRLVFMPHGENVILVLRDHVPVRVIMKDIGEEVGLLSADAPLPEAIERIRVVAPPELEILCVFTDVFDGFFRFLAGQLDQVGLLSAASFWAVVRRVCLDYRDAHPELADRLAEHDLFVEEFPRQCLNRLQLRNNREMVDLAQPGSALALIGTLSNPIAGSAPPG